MCRRELVLNRHSFSVHILMSISHSLAIHLFFFIGGTYAGGTYAEQPL